MTGTMSTPQRIIVGFVAGALAVAVFHQLTILVLTLVGMIPGNAYSLKGVPPWGVPALLNSMFWGGLWGIVFAFIAPKLPTGRNYWLAGVAFGIMGPLLVNWFVVSPIKGQPMAGGLVPLRMLAGLLIGGFFGLGCAVFWRHLPRWLPLGR